MLVLRRKPSEAIVLNGVIKIYVLAVEGDRVKLGINAPPDVIVVREELLRDGSPHQRAILADSELAALSTHPITLPSSPVVPSS